MPPPLDPQLRASRHTAVDALSVVSLCPMERWPSIPRTTLLDALQAGNRRLVRTDQMPPEASDITRNGTLWVEVAVPL